MKKIILIIALLLMSIPSYSQLYLGGTYKPAKDELETDLMYKFDNYGIGIIHNEEKNFFNPHADENTMTYFYLNFPIYYDFLRLQTNYGIGVERDVEVTVQFEWYPFYFEIGGSETEPLIIEFSISF